MSSSRKSNRFHRKEVPLHKHYRTTLMTGNNFDIIVNDLIADTRHIIAETSEEVCSSHIEIWLTNDVITSVQYTRGCDGNTKGVAILLEGMHADEAIKRLSGIDCHGRGTSCPDQLARILKQCLGR